MSFTDFMSRVRLETDIQTQKDLASFLGTEESTITRNKKKDTIPAPWFLKFFQAYKLNPEWLETGEGPKYIESMVDDGTRLRPGNDCGRHQMRVFFQEFVDLDQPME